MPFTENNVEVICDKLTRREVLLLSSMTTIGLLLPGCGGGSSSGGGSLTTPAAGRTVLTGNLSNQLNQYSQAVDNLSTTWQGQSPALDDLQTFMQANKSVSRAASPSAKPLFESVWYGLHGARAGYERIANAIAALDDVGHLGDAVSANNKLVHLGLNAPSFIRRGPDFYVEARRIHGRK